MNVINTIGRRKTAVARIYMKPGNGSIIVNNRELAVYFPTEVLQIVVNQAFHISENSGKFDVKVTFVAVELVVRQKLFAWRFRVR